MLRTWRSSLSGACVALSLAACSSTSEPGIGPEESVPAAPTRMASTIAGINFETGYAPGSPNGQNGWTRTGNYDHVIVTNTMSAPPSFDTQSLRISNAVTSGSFGDHTFAPALTDAAAETDAYSTLNLGARQSRFSAEFSIASADPTAQQTGLAMQVSPDDGFGGRMSFVRFTDEAGGIRIDFIDFQDKEPYGSPANPLDGRSSPDAFVSTTVGTFDRAIPHTIRIEMDLLDGPRNDVVRLYVDGVLVHTGTSWEDYFRWTQCGGCPEATAPVGTFESRPVRTLGFYTRGTAVPANAGKGFLFDNISLESSLLATPVVLSGFFAPVDMGGFVNSAKAGQTIPLKFRLTDSEGAGVQLPGITVAVTSASSAACTSSAVVGTDAIEEYSGNSGLQYLGDGYYQWNWKTSRMVTGCRAVTLDVNGVPAGYVLTPSDKISALFDFRR